MERLQDAVSGNTARWVLGAGGPGAHPASASFLAGRRMLTVQGRRTGAGLGCALTAALASGLSAVHAPHAWCIKANVLERHNRRLDGIHAVCTMRSMRAGSA